MPVNTIQYNPDPIYLVVSVRALVVFDELLVKVLPHRKDGLFDADHSLWGRRRERKEVVKSVQTVINKLKLFVP
jgi:hypothetical protein